MQNKDIFGVGGLVWNKDKQTMVINKSKGKTKKKVRNSTNENLETVKFKADKGINYQVDERINAFDVT